MKPWVQPTRDGFTAVVGPHRVRLRSVVVAANESIG